MQYEEALRKVRALLNLADQTRGSTPEEAANAAAKAQAIMDKFGIDTDDADFDLNTAKQDAEEIKDFGYEDPLDNAKYGNYEESWSVRLASVVAQRSACIARYRRMMDKSSSIRIIGRPSDVQMVRYLYAFFKRQIKELQAEHCKGNSSAYKGQFCNGCIDTLVKKLDESRKAAFAEQRADKNGLALVRVDKAIARIERRELEVKQWFAQHNQVKAGGRGFQGSSTGVSGRIHGQKAGESIRMTGAKGSLGSGMKSLPGS